MKTVKLTCLIFLLVSIATAQAPDTLWTSTYGGSSLDRCFSGIHTSDGGYLLAGFSESFGIGGEDIWVLKTDSAGTYEWTQVFGGGSNDRAYSVVETDDGYFLIGGITASYGAGSNDGWVIKLDSAGNLVWQKTYGLAGEDVITCMAELSDGKYIASGYTSSYSGDEDEAWVMKLNSAGDLQWQKIYPGSGHGCSATGVIETSGGGLAFAGRIGDSSGDLDVWVVTTDDLGNIVHESTLGGSHNDKAWRLAETPEGGFAAIGETQSYGAGVRDLWLIKTDGGCAMEWDLVYGGANAESGTAVRVMPDSGFVVSGYTGSFGSGGLDALLLRVDKSGSTEWDFILGETSLDAAYDVAVLPDFSYTVFGYTDNWGAGSSDFWLVKTMPDLTSIEDDYDGVVPEDQQLSVLQNPFSSSLAISFSLPSAVPSDLVVYDVSGRVVMYNQEVAEQGTHSVFLDTAGWPTGCYQVSLRAGGATSTVRCVKVE